MANMREIRTRISSVQDTMKITNAMYLISSSKLRKARAGRDKVAPYFDYLKLTISDILKRTPALEDEYFEGCVETTLPMSEKKRGFIVITSDKGLAGAYNHNISKLMEEKLKEEAKHDELILVGHMAKTFFKTSDKLSLDDEHIYPAADPVVYRAREITEHVLRKYEAGEYDEVYIAYTQMVNSMLFKPEIMRILPLTRFMFEDMPEDEERLSIPTFSPSPKAVLDKIVPNYVKGLVYGAMVESYACEQSARMTAMDSATENAKEMIRELSLTYNRVRQAAITQEITEIVSGARSQD